MPKRLDVYKFAVIAFGIAAGIAACAFSLFGHASAGDLRVALPEILFMVVVCAACRSLPIYLDDDKAFDLSIIAILMVFLTRGAAEAAMIFLLSSFVTFERSDDHHRVACIYNTDIVKTLFNNASIVIAILVPGLLCELLPWQPGDLSMPMVLFVTVFFSFGTFFVNSVIMLTLFSLMENLKWYELYHTMVGMIPNVLAAMPLGLVMAFFYAQPNGILLVVVLFCPLLLVRHAWKMYVNSLSTQKRLIEALNTTMEARDEYTGGHATRVSEYATLIGAEMGMNPEAVHMLQRGALLHDIGKIGITDTILQKPGPLTAEERTRIEQHPLIGANIIQQVKLGDEIYDMVRHHHERFDGNGYPDHLSGEQLSMNCRIMAVADTYDALRSDRAYRKGFDKARAERIMRENAGTQFDPQVVDALLRVMENRG